MKRVGLALIALSIFSIIAQSIGSNIGADLAGGVYSIDQYRLATMLASSGFIAGVGVILVLIARTKDKKKASAIKTAQNMNPQNDNNMPPVYYDIIQKNPNLDKEIKKCKKIYPYFDIQKELQEPETGELFVSFLIKGVDVLSAYQIVLRQ